MLKNLRRIVARVNIRPDRTVTGFTITKPQRQRRVRRRAPAPLSAIVVERGRAAPPSPQLPRRAQSTQPFAFQLHTTGALCE